MNPLPFVLLLLLAVSCAKAPEPFGPVPSASQLAWQKMETNLFVHFGPNTFSGVEWGDGTEPEDLFRPSELDCRQWASVARAGGFRGIILTAKHHDGFCLWPSATTSHTVAGSSWKEGKGDVLKELSQACREYGLSFGVYLSPWDRHHPAYGTKDYNALYARALEEVHTGYGPVFEQWFDGACGEGPGGKLQHYDWPLFHSAVLEHSPQAVMFSDVGPGCRWVGNESGTAGETNWSRLDTEGFTPGLGAPPADTLQQGNIHGASWIPAEADVSIRPGWFWRASEDDKVKSVEELLDIYYRTVGRNALLLLNIPADDRGLLPAKDSAVVAAFYMRLEGIFSRNLADGATLRASASRGGKFGPENLLSQDYDRFWAVPDRVLTPEVELRLPAPQTFNRILLQEYIPLGQRVASFTVEALLDGRWHTIAEGTTIGYKRILLTDAPVTTSRIRLRITQSLACPVLNRLGLYLD